MTDDYIKEIQDALSASPFVSEPRITIDDRGEALFLRADVYFIDDSLLHFRELLIGQSHRVKKAYAYHYQRGDGTVVFRYDNAPHYPHLPTAPHHKHVGENYVIASTEPDLQSVLQEIESLIETV